MPSPHEALGIPPETVDRIGRLSPGELAGYVGPWLVRIEGSNGNPLVSLASNHPERDSLAHQAGGDLQAIHVEMATRAVRTLLGPDARIVMGEPNGE